MIKRSGKFKEWLTPVSHFKNFNILFLTYDHPWYLVIENPEPDEDFNYCFEFSRPYKVSILSITNLFKISWNFSNIEKLNKNIFILEDSSLINELRYGYYGPYVNQGSNMTYMVDVTASNAIHYVILAKNYLFEVVTNKVPCIIKLKHGQKINREPYETETTTGEEYLAKTINVKVEHLV